jgi:hypothetical protein
MGGLGRDGRDHRPPSPSWPRNRSAAAPAKDAGGWAWGRRPSAADRILEATGDEVEGAVAAPQDVRHDGRRSRRVPATGARRGRPQSPESAGGGMPAQI